MIKVDEGQILVNCAWISIKTDSLIRFDLDTKSKYPEVLAYSANDLYLCASNRTLHLGKSEKITTITLDLPKDFVIGAYNIGRYDVSIYCFNKNTVNENPAIIWETSRI